MGTKIHKDIFDDGLKLRSHVTVFVSDYYNFLEVKVFLDENFILLYKWLFSRVLKFANVHCRPVSREYIFAVKYIQLSPKLTCSN